MKDCLFCKMIAGEIPVQKVYEDEHFLAFLDIHPVNIGHTLVIPKVHSANLYDTTDETLSLLAPVIKKLAIAIKKGVSANGINIEMNNEASAGQIIFHTHIHVIPRFSSDGFKHWHGAREYRDGEMAEIEKKVKMHL
ncbi:MAG: HIT family protein [Patescibacteria group bacterium]